MSATACIIQARLGSTRLSAKVLLPLPSGRTVLEEVVFRCRQIKGVDVVVVAVADDAGSDIVADHAMKARFAPRDEPGSDLSPLLVTRGPEHDVLKRYVMAAEEVKADIVMRVTADCPLIDSEVCAEVLDHFNEIQKTHTGPLYCSNVHPRSYPKGLDCEVFSMSALKQADEWGLEPECREHVTAYMVDSSIAVGNVRDEQDRSEIRWTLDTIADYITIWNEFEYEKTVREWQDAPRVGREMI